VKVAKEGGVTPSSINKRITPHVSSYLSFKVQNYDDRNPFLSSVLVTRSV
jgi:hypothetical protein